MKKRTSVYIEEELLDYAKKNGLNLSKLLEGAIKREKKRKRGAMRWTADPLYPGSNPGPGLTDK